MSVLHVKPIDNAQAGSRKERIKIMRVFDRVQKAGSDFGAMADALEALEGLIRPYLYTENGASVDELWDELSADQFDQLVPAILGVPSVPPESTASSTGG